MFVVLCVGKGLHDDSINSVNDDDDDDNDDDCTDGESSIKRKGCISPSDTVKFRK